MLFRFSISIVLMCLAQNMSVAQSEWNKTAARDYLDARASTWSQWNSSSRDSGATRCVACHTGMYYALARRPLGKALGEENLSTQEENLINNVKRRATDQDRQLYYEMSDLKKSQSKGTEAVINSLILSLRDRQSRHETLSDETAAAFAEVWSSQVNGDGAEAGSLPWLDFRLEPWESAKARYYGASLAAIALGNTPDSYQQSADIGESKQRLFDYLKTNFDGATLHGKVYAYWAHLSCDNVLTDDQVNALIVKLDEKQSEDSGGWALKDLLGSDGDDQTVDGYATGLITFVLLKSGQTPEAIDTAKALQWLKQTQMDDGSWPAKSVNRNRNPDSHTGKFMRDAATAFAVLALLESEQ